MAVGVGFHTLATLPLHVVPTLRYWTGGCSGLRAGLAAVLWQKALPIASYFTE